MACHPIALNVNADYSRNIDSCKQDDIVAMDNVEVHHSDKGIEYEIFGSSLNEPEDEDGSTTDTDVEMENCEQTFADENQFKNNLKWHLEKEQDFICPPEESSDDNLSIAHKRKVPFVKVGEEHCEPLECKMKSIRRKMKISKKISNLASQKRKYMQMNS